MPSHLHAVRSEHDRASDVVAPIGLGSLVSAQLMRNNPGIQQPSKLWLAVHVTSNVIGVGLFLLSAGVATAYLAQSARLKAKRADTGNRQFPGLLPMELLMRRLLLIGFVPLSLGIVTGAAFANRMRLGGVDALRIALAYGVWLFVGVLIFGGRAAGWRGRKVAWGTIMGALFSILVVLMYVLSPSLGTGGR